VPPTAATPSAREIELLEAAYRYVLDHGLTDLSLRPLAEAIGSSPRVLLFLFESKEGLIRALLERARADELALLHALDAADRAVPADLATAGDEIWRWLAAPEHRPLLRLWAETYVASLVDPDGPWAGFASATVDSWLEVLASYQAPAERISRHGEERRTLALAVLRGGLLDLLATHDDRRVSGAVHHGLALLTR
jgi:AcrR family transcriptional regulator